MNKFEKIKTLDKSIQKWKDIVFNGGEDEGFINCPCCEEWYFWQQCKGCPIGEMTGPSCNFDEYEKWSTLMYNYDLISWEIVDDKSKKVANAMLSALYEIRRSYIASIYKY